LGRCECFYDIYPARNERHFHAWQPVLATRKYRLGNA
jgi:hypothetical protein